MLGRGEGEKIVNLPVQTLRSFASSHLQSRSYLTPLSSRKSNRVLGTKGSYIAQSWFLNICILQDVFIAANGEDYLHSLPPIFNSGSFIKSL